MATHPVSHSVHVCSFATAFPWAALFLFVCSFAKSAILKQFPCISLTWGVFDLISRSSETKWKIWLANWDKSSTPRFPCPPKTWSNISVVYFLPCSNFSLPALFECVCVVRVICGPSLLASVMWNSIIHVAVFDVLLRCCCISNKHNIVRNSWKPCCFKRSFVVVKNKCWCIELDIMHWTKPPGFGSTS